jgi:hypothetical protein
MSRARWLPLSRSCQRRLSVSAHPPLSARFDPAWMHHGCVFRPHDAVLESDEDELFLTELREHTDAAFLPPPSMQLMRQQRRCD